MALKGRIIPSQDRAVAVLRRVDVGPRLRRPCEYQILSLATAEHTQKQ